MGNLFIGFPVPRAKIAEMIEGSAPPIIHHDRHEASGDDEIPFEDILNRKHAARHQAGGDDLVSMPPAGAPFPWDGINIGSTFEDYQAYDFVGDEGTEYFISTDGLILHWREGSSGVLSCIRKLFTDDPLPLWTKKQRFDVAFKSYANTPTANQAFCLRGAAMDNCFGFRCLDGELFGIIGNAPGCIAQVSLLTVEQWNGHPFILSAHLYPNNFNCKFYVNGVYIDEVTSEACFPTGSDYLDYVFYMALMTDNVNDYTNCNYWNFWQEF